VLQSMPLQNSMVGKATLSLIRKAIRHHGMLQQGDRVAVGLSGGKDSLMLYCALRQLQREFDLCLQAVHLDQHQPGYERDTFEATLKHLDISCEVVSEDTWSVVSASIKPNQTPCALCSRMRRGILNQWCASQGFSKLALGHHLDDAVETFFLNLMYGRRLQPMKATTPSEVNVLTIRPLLWVQEATVQHWVQRYQVAVVPCPVCDSLPNAKRRETKSLIKQMQTIHPDLLQSVRGALYQKQYETSLPSIQAKA